METGGVAAVIGRINAAKEVTIKNVTIKNSTINGKNKVGCLVGQIMSNVTLHVTGCKIENTTINCSEGEAGKVIGCLTWTNTVEFDKPFAEWVKDVELNLVQGKMTRNVVDISANNKVMIDGEEVSQNVTSVVDKLKSTGEKEGCRFFFKDAYLTALVDGNSTKTISVGGNKTELKSTTDRQHATVIINGKTFNEVVVSKCIAD